MAKEKILFIIPFLPYPLTSGGHQALYNGIAAVCNDFEIHITFEAFEGCEYEQNAREFCRLVGNVHLHPFFRPVKERSIKRKLFDKGVGALRRIFGEYPVKTTPLSSTINWWKITVNPIDEAWTNHISNLCSTNSFDGIQVEMPWLLPAIFALPDNVKKVYVHHELGFVRRKLEVVQFGSVGYAECVRKFCDHNEISQLNLYDCVITLSTVDTKKLISAGVNVPVHSSFAIVDSSPNITPYIGEERILTFIGPDLHNPNFVGITWFLDNCWNKLKAKDKSYKLRIIGKWSEENVQIYTGRYKDVEFLGFVDDLYEVIKGTVMIVPITVGSGIRMKILEAASKGVPFVSTTIGAEGIPVVDGKDCFLTDDPDMFVTDILKLRDVDLRKQFILNANKMVQEHYSLDALRRNRLQIYKDLLVPNE